MANKSLDEMRKLAASITPSASSEVHPPISAASNSNTGSWDNYRQSWSSQPRDDVFSFFSPEVLRSMSNHQLINSCFALGTVLALTLESATPGYNSTAAASLQARLMTTLDEQGRGVHSRVLGDVIYFMVGMGTPEFEVRSLERTILKALDGEVAVRR